MDLFWFLVRNNKVPSRSVFRRLLCQGKILVNSEPMSLEDGAFYQMKNNDTVQVGTGIEGWMLYTGEGESGEETII